MEIIELLYEIIEGILSAIIEGFFGCLNALFSKERKTEFDADFAKSADVSLSRSNQGFTFGNVSLPIIDSFRNAIIYGMTGAGKNVCVLVNSILRMAGPSNLFIHDPSKELWKLCSGFLKLMGYDIIIIDYLNPKLGGYNCLHGIAPTDIPAIQKTCKLLIHITLGQSKDPFWNLASENFLKILIQIVLYGPAETHSMHNVLILCNQFVHSPKDVDRLVVESKNEILLSEYKTFLKYDSKMMMSLIATIKASLNLWNDPQIQLCTSYDTMQMKEWRKKKICLFIHSSVPMMRYYSPLTSLFFEQSFAQIMSEIPSITDRPCFFLIDECSSLFLESMSITYSNIRKYKGGVLSVFQSPFQLQQIYSSQGAKAVEDNAYAKLYMPGVDILVANQIEQMLGKFEYIDEKNVRHIRPLMVGSEVREATFSLLFTGQNRAVKLDLKPYYKQPRLLKKTQHAPAYPTNSAPFDTPPTIQFKPR